jgi:hypothetical protein
MFAWLRKKLSPVRHGVWSVPNVDEVVAATAELEQRINRGH